MMKQEVTTEEHRKESEKNNSGFWFGVISVFGGCFLS
jgi:hypothetical protein